jgi:hypothetical protein
MKIYSPKSIIFPEGKLYVITQDKIIFREIKIIFHPLGSHAGFPARAIVL